VFASSSSVYGVNSDGIASREGDKLSPMSPYAIQKYTGEMYCEMASRIWNLQTTLLRFFNVFGPRQNLKSEYSAAIPRFIDATLRGTPITVYGDGEQKRDFTYIDNVVQSIIIACERTIPVDVCNIASGCPCSVNELIDVIFKLVGKKTKVNHVASRLGEPRYSHAAIEKMKIFLPYKMIGLEEGLGYTIENAKNYVKESV
jgi:nucleoside-diphosphate-sugar epimerase